MTGTPSSPYFGMIPYERDPFLAHTFVFMKPPPAFAFIILGLTALLPACTTPAETELSGAGMAAENGSTLALVSEIGTPPSAVQGKDYIILERRRFLDTQGFDQPVEAFSFLVPKDWKSEGGIRWKGIQECRGEIITQWATLTSPDGLITIRSLPMRSFAWADDQFMFQAMQMAAQQGGCAMGPPFDGGQYLQHLAQNELGGAQVVSVKDDPDMMQKLKQIDDQGNAISRQYGNTMTQSSSAVVGQLNWPDGSHGRAMINVTNMVSTVPDHMNGGTTSYSSSTVSFQVIARYPPDRKDEADRILAATLSSFKTNPQWQQATSNFLTELGNSEHRASMDRIKWMGEQSRAQAQERSRQSDQQMRDWEKSQSSSDDQHKSFIQTIREVETWSDGSSKVELGSGYDKAWSAPDGSYILSNSASFDPNTVFQDQNWNELQRTKP